MEYDEYYVKKTNTEVRLEGSVSEHQQERKG